LGLNGFNAWLHFTALRKHLEVFLAVGPQGIFPRENFVLLRKGAFLWFCIPELVTSFVANSGIEIKWVCENAPPVIC